MKFAAILTVAACLLPCSFAAAAEGRAEFGIDKRTPWTTSRIVGSPDPPPKYVVERVFPSLSFSEPAEMGALPGTDRLIVVEVKGKLFSFPNHPESSQVTLDPFADLTTIHPDFFRVYGITFHPRFAENRYCYVCYVLKAGTPDGTRVSRFKVNETDPPTLDLASEQHFPKGTLPWPGILLRY